MKSRSTLTLMELLIMVLVFALAAALCLQAFAGANRISETAAARDRAVLEAQNAAEVLKSCSGCWEEAAHLYGGTWDGSVWTLSWDSGTLRAAPTDSGDPLLGQAEITVTDRDGNLLIALTAAWQKGGSSHE